MELEKAYDHTKVEDKIYKQWMDSDYFNPDNLNGEPYTIIMPPPNVTGTLHIGHALMVTIEDILIRHKRMQGRKTLWLPGTDHAAIATQSKVEKLLEKEEGKRKQDLGREEFLKRVQAFAQESHDTIINQLKSIGASCDWSREAFTLDETRNFAVRTAFKQLYDLGLIYRGYRVINWDVKGQTTISDDEVVYTERPAKLYTFKYGKDFPITISTTRPETKVGDTAVAVHPTDERYKEFVGKEYDEVFCGVPIHIKIIADESVEKDFGTGALGVTPAHSMVDWEMSQHHGLPIKPVINEYGKMTVGGENILGKKTTEAREAIVQWLKDEGLLEKEEDITQNVGTAERTGSVIEPLPKLQWFIDVNKEFPFPHSEIEGIKEGEMVSLKKLMRHVVENGQISITPAHFTKIYSHWIDNLRDWCISRQIWYGHRIPVWYDITNKDNALGIIEFKPGLKITAEQEQFLREKTYRDYLAPYPYDTQGQKEIHLCSFDQAKLLIEKGWISLEYLHAHAEAFDVSGCTTLLTEDVPPIPQTALQDPDTLDTWFSSGLWTFSTLGWPEQTKDLKTFHPTDVMETGYDILFFWVARMILMTTTLIGQVPFRQVFLHGIVRDANREKMSKSKGNVIDPLNMSAKYGTDAVRFALVFNTAPGTDMALAEDKIKGMKHFGNKLWNIARYVLQNITIPNIQFPIPNVEPSTDADKEILAKLEETIKAVTDNLERFQLHEAAQSVYQFTWHEFADIYVEASKLQLQDETSKENTQKILLHSLITILKLLHPFMPFVTEEIWGRLREAKLVPENQLLMVSHWPK